MLPHPYVVGPCCCLFLPDRRIADRVADRVAAHVDEAEAVATQLVELGLILGRWEVVLGEPGTARGLHRGRLLVVSGRHAVAPHGSGGRGVAPGADGARPLRR